MGYKRLKALISEAFITDTVMKVKQFMTRSPHCLAPTDTVRDALSVMVKHKIAGCPVNGNDKRIKGVVSQSDIIQSLDLHRTVVDAKSPLFSLIVHMLNNNDIKPLINNLATKRIKEIMQTSVQTIDENEDVYRAVTLMNKNKVNRLIVVRNGLLAGVISKKDIIQMLGEISA